MSRLRDTLSRPQTWVWTHGFMVVFWIAMIYPAVTRWRDSVPFLVSISVIALVLSSMASLQSARADCNSPTAEDHAKLQGMVRELLRRVPERDEGRAP